MPDFIVKEGRIKRDLRPVDFLLLRMDADRLRDLTGAEVRHRVSLPEFSGRPPAEGESLSGEEIFTTALRSLSASFPRMGLNERVTLSSEPIPLKIRGELVDATNPTERILVRVDYVPEGR